MECAEDAGRRSRKRSEEDDEEEEEEEEKKKEEEEEEGASSSAATWTGPPRGASHVGGTATWRMTCLPAVFFPFFSFSIFFFCQPVPILQPSKIFLLFCSRAKKKGKRKKKNGEIKSFPVFCIFFFVFAD
jgi:hypothetical protein